MVKQCFEQAHMTCAEFGLWKQYTMLAYKSGRLFCDGRKTAERFSGESKDHIYRLRKSLIDKGWLVPTKQSGVDKKTGRRTAAEFTVLDHPQWTKKHGKTKCKSSLFSDLEPVAPVQMEKESPVAPVQTACRTGANGPVAPARHSSKENQLQENLVESIANPENTFLKLGKEKLTDGQSIRLAEPNIAPVAPVQMVNGSPVPETVRVKFPNLFWFQNEWCHRSGTTNARPEELAEMRRRKNLRLKPADFIQEIQQ